MSDERETREWVWFFIRMGVWIVSVYIAWAVGYHAATVERNASEPSMRGYP